MNNEEKWIDVNDRLPEKHQVVLVADEKDVFCAVYTPGRWVNYDWSEYIDGGPTLVSHWMPLPDPPK